ncbi:MAG: GNAT family N-acetyltransferase [Clostridiales bacterium]|nr:GNAT family N-acetyltransferase [Clostridiales bacterium]
MDYQEIKLLDSEQISALSKMATAILREHYDAIVGVKQNDYMLAKFQSIDGITEQLKNGYKYYFVRCNNENIGFIAYYVRKDDLYLSKFYLRKDQRGKGIARDMLKFLVNNAKFYNRQSIVVNVNKQNSSIKIYEKLGFVRIGAEKIDIGQGYYMDDYIYKYIID